MGGHTFHPCKQRPKSILCVYCRWSYCGHIWVVYTCLVGQRIGTCFVAVYLCTRSVCENLQETCQEGFSLHARGCCACAGGGNNDARLSLTCPRIPESQFFFLWFPFWLPCVVLWRLPFWHLMVAGSARERRGPSRCLCANNGGNEELLVHLCVCVSVSVHSFCKGSCCCASNTRLALSPTSPWRAQRSDILSRRGEMATVSTTTIPPNLNLAHLAFIGFPGLNQWRPHLRSVRLRSAIARRSLQHCGADALRHHLHRNWWR